MHQSSVRTHTNGSALGRRSVMAGAVGDSLFFADDATFSIRRSVFATSVRPVARDPVDHDLWSYWPVGRRVGYAE